MSGICVGYISSRGYCGNDGGGHCVVTMLLLSKKKRKKNYATAIQVFNRCPCLDTIAIAG